MFASAVAGLYDTPMTASAWAAFTAAAVVVKSRPRPTPPPTTAPVASVIRIDTGRGPHTDISGRTWARDEGFVTGGNVSITPYEVANTFEDPLYYTRRWGNFEYSLPVPGGTFDVRLHFADPVYTTGYRRFNVYAENKLVLNRFDVAASGGGQAALVRSLIVNVTDGSLDLRFRNVVENAILSAIEVVPRADRGLDRHDQRPLATTESQAAAVREAVRLRRFHRVTAAARRACRNVYDPDADTWTKIADMPRPITAAGTAADGNTVWLAGGFVGDASVKAATATSGSTTSLRPLDRRAAVAKAIAGGRVVRLGRSCTFGGTDAAGSTSPTTTSSTSTAPRPRRRVAERTRLVRRRDHFAGACASAAEVARASPAASNAPTLLPGGSPTCIRTTG